MEYIKQNDGGKKCHLTGRGVRTSRNHARDFPSFFTELEMPGVVGHGEGQWL